MYLKRFTISKHRIHHVDPRLAKFMQKNLWFVSSENVLLWPLLLRQSCQLYPPIHPLIKCLDLFWPTTKYWESSSWLLSITKWQNRGQNRNDWWWKFDAVGGFNQKANLRLSIATFLPIRNTLLSLGYDQTAWLSHHSCSILDRGQIVNLCAQFVA